MKNIFLILFTVTLSGILSEAAARVDTDTSCSVLKNSFNGFFNKKDYSSALPLFHKMFNECKDIDKGTLYRGSLIYESLCADTANKKTIKNCSDTLILIYLKLHRLSPSGNTGLQLGKLYSEKNENEKASDYFKEAMEFETDPVIKSQILMEIANHSAGKLNDRITARTYAQRAASLNPGWGQPFIFIGKLYASAQADCKEDIFKGKSCYWAASDKFELAGKTDTTLKKEAEMLILQYSEFFPGKSDVDKARYIPGERFKVKCWINEETIIRTK